MIYSEQANLLTSFQRWALLYLHNSEASSSGLGILKACCITAMTDNFQKRDVIEGLSKLERLGLIRKIQSGSKNPAQMDQELSDHYSITGDGVIYAKKMLRPVLDLLSDTEKGERIAQKLTDGKTRSWLRSLLKSSGFLVQQQAVDRIICYGLGNISGLGQLIEMLRKGIPSS